MNEETLKQLKNNKITILNIWYKGIENIDILSKSLKYNNSLKKLWLDDNEINKEDKNKLLNCKNKNLEIIF